MIYLNSNSQKLMMSLDWLQWSGYLIGDGANSLPDMECPDTYRLELLSGNQVFKYRAILYDRFGDKCLTLLWCPKSPMMQWNLITFQVANRWFYDIHDIQDTINLASDVFIYQFATMSRIDICVDFELHRKQKSIIKGLYHHKVLCCGKRENSMFESKTPKGMFPHDFNFGSFKSSVRWKLYNKSKELRADEDDCDKPYIVERWRQNGMNITNIWRCEVSITDFNKFMLADKPINFDGKLQYTTRHIELTDINDLTIYTIYCDIYEKRFQLRKQGHTRQANNERVYLFDLEQHKIYQPTKRGESKRLDNSLMYSLIHVVESDHCKVNKEMLEYAAYSLFLYVKRNNLDDLFCRLKGKDCETWCQEQIDNCGMGIVNNLNYDED